ncbi:MAG: 3-oxoacyl-[acyl-carrier-protein] synthase III C-terminal domain-containing protein [Candidatus Acidiferrales bacterium]
MSGNHEAAAGIVGWGWAVGSERVEVARVEKEFGLSPGRILERAGIESVARVSPDENELTLAAVAAETALKRGTAECGDIDWIIASSETMLTQPSLGAALHARLKVRESCGALDVGGACLGLLNCLHVAQALLAGGSVRSVLVVTADVHSSRFLPGVVPPTFGALFGDGASAFLLRRVETNGKPCVFRLGEFQFGCVGTHAAALQFAFAPDGKVAMNFDGEALAHAAVSRLKKVVENVALRSGVSLDAAFSFAIHQPNPRLVELFARQAQIPPTKIPKVATTFGNLGTSTCGVALALALDQSEASQSQARGPLFLAAVAPGLTWGGGLLYG